MGIPQIRLPGTIQYSLDNQNILSPQNLGTVFFKFGVPGGGGGNPGGGIGEGNTGTGTLPLYKYKNHSASVGVE